MQGPHKQHISIEGNSDQQMGLSVPHSSESAVTIIHQFLLVVLSRSGSAAKDVPFNNTHSYKDTKLIL